MIYSSCNRKGRYMKKIIMLVICALAAISITACGGDSNSSSSRSGICQFDGCTNKATSIGGNFCSYHNKALNDYWDAGGK